LPSTLGEDPVTWLWSDALAALLVEYDQVAAARLLPWVERPVAYRLTEGADPVELARRLLGAAGEPTRQAQTNMV
jgi:hypothetical protein